MLYDSGKYKLARRRKLNYNEIQKQAQEYFDEKLDRANGFLKATKLIYDNMNDYKLCSFNLHQTCENLFYATRLVFALQNNKQHNLLKLMTSVKKYSNEFMDIFPRKTTEEKRLFELVKSAYVEARYNPNFVVTKEDVDALIPMINQLFELVKRICDTRIKEYGEMK